ncbi:hypothetical protein AMR72_04145 [Flavobacterium psychrophilum]|nr:hypothetical protein AMR72_04145 [Flavobacterium psychrophilum]AOE51775.1 hypothetical protein ALW18_04140 [Flavobacterium psychrophilum]
MRNRFYATLLAFVISFAFYGQTKIDTTFIGSYDQKMMVKAFLTRNSIEIGHNNKDYSPNNPTRLGLGFSIKNTVVDFSYSFGLLPAGKEYGKTKSFDFQIHNYGRKFLFDVFYQNYKGFYSDNKVITTYPETSVQLIGGEITYVFNNRQFSAKAAFDQTQKQLQSAGSWLIGGGAYYFKLGLQELTGDTSIDNFQLGVNGGYGYSWVINEHWLLSGMATVGVNAGNEWESFKYMKLKLYPTAFARGAAGYRKDDWGVGLSFIINNKQVYYMQDDFSLASINMQITYVKHLDNIFKWGKRKR